MEHKFFNAFNNILNFGPKCFKEILDNFNFLERAWGASENELKNKNISEKTIEKILAYRDKINPDKEFEKVKNEGVEIITIKDENYPKLLREIPHPPALLYVKGEIPEEEFIVAVVGTRHPTQYGKDAAEKLTSEIVKIGGVVVSGLAAGIDTVSHKTALEYGGKTIAVLGTGVDEKSVYPQFNKNLAREIIEKGGAVISEFPIGMGPQKFNFPQRNRIISGLSLGSIVVEAAEKSGALITAAYALEQNREVFAVPGLIFSKNSVGPNMLIKSGAKATTCIEDIIEELGINIKENHKKSVENNLDEKEKAIIDFISQDPIHIDKIIKLAKLDVSEVYSALLMLEMKGIVKNLGGGNYRLKSL